MSSDGRLRIRCRATTALCCSLASLAALAASPAKAADECGPVPLGGGTIECPTADYPDGISYDAGVEDLTVVVDPGSTLEDAFSLIGNADLTADLSGDSVTTTSDFANGVSVNSTAGAIGIRVGDVSTSGDGAAGVYSRGIDYALIYSGNVTTTGDGSAGVEAIGNAGYEVVVADFTNTSGEGSAGVSIGTKSGDVFAMTFGVETSGDYSAGIQISSGSGDIVSQSGQHIILGQVTTHGDHSDAIDLSTVDGNITSRSQNVTTFGDYSAGIHAVSGTGNIAIFNGFNTSGGLINTYGILSDGIHAETAGSIGIVSDTVRTSGGGSDGIYAKAGGDIAILSNSIQTLGGGSDGIEAHSTYGSVLIGSSNIETKERGIVADARYDIAIDSGSIDAEAYGPYGAVNAIQAVSGAGSIGITSGDLTTKFDRGIYARADYGSIAVDAGSIHTTGAGGQGAVLFAGGDIDVTVDDLSTHSDAFLADGIIAYSGGAISIAAGNVDVYGGHASALLGYAQHGNVDMSANDVTLAYNAIWGPSGAGEAITGLSRYGDVTIAAHNVYSQGRGIAAEALYGNVSITANNVVAGSEAGYSGGVFAFTLFGDATVAVNDVTTHDQYGIAGQVRVEGALDMSFNSVNTSGYVATGVTAFGGGYTSSVVVTGDSIDTDGAVAIGFWGFNYGSGGSTVDINTITTHGEASDWIAFTNDSSFNYYGDIYYSTLRLHAGAVATSGNYSDGVNLTSHAGDIYARIGSISTSGDRSAGLVLVDTGGHLAPPNYGYGTHFFRPGDFDIQVNSIETSGDYSTAIAGYLQAGELHLGVDSIATHGDYASGVVLSSGFVLFGPPGSELFDIDIGQIDTDGNDSNGIVIYGNGAPVHIDVGTVTTHGTNSSGIVALGLGDINVTAGSVDLSVAQPSDATYYSTGVYGVSFGGNVQINADSVSTGGDKSSGIIASSNGRIGYYGDVYTGSVTVAADKVATSGSDAVGVAASSLGGNVSIDAGSVETDGDYSIGIAGNALAFIPGIGATDHDLRGGDLTIVADDVVTHGDHSDGVSAIGFSGGDTNVTIGTVTTSGDDSYGVNVVTSGQVDSYTGQFYGGSTTVSVDKVTTTGDGSNGVRVFAFTGDVDLTVGSADVSGANSDAVIGVNGSNGSTIVNILDHAISQQGFGVAASAYDNVAVNLADAAHVSGGQVGVYANGYQSIDVNIGDGAEIFGGEMGVYAGVDGNDQASALITNLGQIATGANGMAIVADGHDVTIDNPGIVIGPVKLTDHIGLFDNSGTWQAFGNSEFGFGSDTVLNTGHVIAGIGQAGEHINVTGLDTFDNRGLITIADGHADQVLNLDRATMIGGTGSKLAVDIGADAHGLTSDLLQLGVASGATELQLNGHGGLGTALVVDANASSGSGNFFLPGGVVDLGFVRMSLDYNAAKSNWSLVGTPDQETFEGTRFAAQAQSLWRRGIDVWSQTLDEAPTPERFTLWGKYLTGHENQDLNPTFTTLGVTSSPILRTDASWDGALIGASFGRGPWSWGALVGVTSQTSRFTFDDNKLRSKGSNLGAYAAWQSDKMFARAVANYQHVRAHADLPTAGVSDARMHGSVAGVRGEMGLRLPFGAAEFRPMVSATWTRGHLSDLTAPGATLNFDGFTSLEASAGALLSGAMRVGTTTLHPYAGLYGVKEFRGRNSLDFEVGSQSLRIVGQPQNDHAKATAGFAADLGGAFRLSVGGEAEFFGGRNALKGQIGLSWHG